jgi:hypothetical protein
MHVGSPGFASDVVGHDERPRRRCTAASPCGSVVLVLVDLLEPGLVHVGVLVRIAVVLMLVLVLVLDVLVVVPGVRVRMGLAVMLVLVGVRRIVRVLFIGHAASSC